MKQLVVDAGPLIGLFYARDPLHLECVAGFKQLNAAKALVLTPIPIIFEVYKWLLQRTQLWRAVSVCTQVVAETVCGIGRDRNKQTDRQG